MSEQAKEVAPVTTQATSATATTTTTPEVKPQETAPATKVEEKPAAEAKPEAGKEAADKKLEEKKPAETQKVVPDKYELKAPDGSLLKQSDLDKVAAIAKERGLSQEEAQKVLEERGQLKGDFLSEQREDFAQLRTKWQQDFINDPDFGGEKAKENAEHAKRFLDKFADPDFRKALNEFGFGDHPGLVRMCIRAGLAGREDKRIAGGDAPVQQETRAADLMFPTHKQQQGSN